MLRRLLLLVVVFATNAAAALDPNIVSKLGFGDNDEKVAAIGALASTGDAQAMALLQALADAGVQTAGQRVLIVKGDAATHAATGEAVKPLPEAREDVVGNNRVRRELEGAMASLRLLAPQ